MVELVVEPPVPLPTTRLCGYCSKEYSPVRKSQKFCSKNCNNKDQYHRRAEKAADEAASFAPPPPVIEPAPPPEPVVVAPPPPPDPLKAKLDRIRKTCPAPIKRPEIQRGF